MPLTLQRILKCFLAAGIIGLGATIIYAAATRLQTSLSAWAFGLGVAVVLAAVPIMPWLLALPALTHRAYWGTIIEPPEEDDDGQPVA